MKRKSRVVFTQHVRMKLAVLKRHGFEIREDDVMDAVFDPDRVSEGYKGRKIAQKVMSPVHVLRVVYEKVDDDIRVITVYPGRRERYEQDPL